MYVHGSILMWDRLLHTIPDDALKRLLNEVGRFRMLYAIVAWSPQLNSSHSSVLMLRQTCDPDGTTHLVWRLYDPNIPFDNMTMEPTFDVQEYVTSFQDLLNNLGSHLQRLALRYNIFDVRMQQCAWHGSQMAIPTQPLLVSSIGLPYRQDICALVCMAFLMYVSEMSMHVDADTYRLCTVLQRMGRACMGKCKSGVATVCVDYLTHTLAQYSILIASEAGPVLWRAPPEMLLLGARQYNDFSRVTARHFTHPDCMCELQTTKHKEERRAMERIQEFSDNRIPNDSKAVYSLFAVVENDQMQQSHIAVHPVDIVPVSGIFAMETHLPLAVIGLWDADI